MVVSESSAQRYALDPDVRLMLEVRDGSAVAFEELVLRYQGRLVRVLEHLVGSREQAEDLAQEVFLRIYRSRQHYVPAAKFATWLFTIADNVASNALRDRSRRREVHLAPLESESTGIRPLDRMIEAASGLMPARQLAKAEMREVVRAALESLGAAAADGRAAQQVRRDELRRHRRGHGNVAAGDQVAAVAGTGKPAADARSRMSKTGSGRANPTESTRETASQKAMPENPADNQKLRDELVAYLDGELDPEQIRQVETRLAEEPETRRMLQDLDRTWHMLDELEEASVDEHFTRTTLEMVAVAAADDAQRQEAEAPRRRRRFGLGLGGAAVLSALAGFVAVFLLTPDPNARLLRDLPVLENLDQYRQIDNIDFLRKLRDDKLFTGDSDEKP